MPPDWTRPEVLLALDVYFRHGRRQLRTRHPAMERLRDELREIAPDTHPGYDPSPTFRNLDGLSYKFGGYIGLDPNHDAGGTNFSQLEEQVFQEFLDNPAGMHLEVLETREELGLASSTNRWWTDGPGESWDSLERFWIEITDREDLGANLRAPRYDRGGEENWRYTMLLDVRPGDVVYHYGKNERAITARSVAENWARDEMVTWAPRGSYGRQDDPQEQSGMSIELGRFEELSPVVPLQRIREEVESLQSTHQELNQQYNGALYLPFSIHQGGEVRPNQVYLAKFPSAYFDLFPSLRSDPLAAEANDGSGTRPDRSVGGTGSRNEGQEDNTSRPAHSRNTGQGYASTAEERKAIEEASMQAARTHFENEGFEVEDRSANNPYDLLCRRDGERLYVEVKGTTTSGQSVHLTRGEVEHARSHQGEAALFVVKNMELVESEDNLEARGGEQLIRYPWHPEEDALTPTRYDYQLR